MDPNLPQHPNQNVNQTPQQIPPQQSEKPPRKIGKYKLPILLVTLIIILFLITSVILALTKPELLRLGSKSTEVNTWSLDSKIQSDLQSDDAIKLEKVKTIKQKMDKICDDFGYYDKASVGNIEEKFGDSGCADQGVLSGEWPNKCMNGGIDYWLDEEISDAPGSPPNPHINDFGEKSYGYSYRFKCDSPKSKIDPTKDWPTYEGEYVTFRYHPSWSIKKERLWSGVILENIEINMPEYNNPIRVSFSDEDYSEVSQEYINRGRNKEIVIGGKKGIRRLTYIDNNPSISYMYLYATSGKDNIGSFLVSLNTKKTDNDLEEHLDNFVSTIEYK